MPGWYVEYFFFNLWICTITFFSFSESHRMVGTHWKAVFPYLNSMNNYCPDFARGRESQTGGHQAKKTNLQEN